jgi:hypothetical protein
METLASLEWAVMLEDFMQVSPCISPETTPSSPSSPSSPTRVVINMRNGTAIVVGDCTPHSLLEITQSFEKPLPVASSSPTMYHPIHTIKPRVSLPVRLGTPCKIEKQRKTSQPIIFVDDSHTYGIEGKVMREKSNKFRKKSSDFDDLTRYFRIK